MTLETDLNKILIIGSGPALVGDVAEMDAVVWEAMEGFLEEGVEVVLVNPNPATVSTDKRAGVTVYLEPMTLPFLKRILRMEEPDAILPIMGSKIAIKVAQKLLNDGILSEMGIRLLGINQTGLALHRIKNQVKLTEENKVPMAQYWKMSDQAYANLEQWSNSLQYPILVNKHQKYSHNRHFRINDPEQLVNLFKNDLQADLGKISDYTFVEDLSNWEEITINLLRDNDGNFHFLPIVESLESVMIDSEDSTHVIPALSLNNDDTEMLKKNARKLANAIDLVGICSFHFGVKRSGGKLRYRLLDISPRVTKSTIWSERTTTYNVGYVLSKILLGYHLNEIIDKGSGQNAVIEPVLDSVSVRMPFWSLSNSGKNHYKLSSHPKASGEVVGVGRNFESAFLKALTSTIGQNIIADYFSKSLETSPQELLNNYEALDQYHWLKLLCLMAKGSSLETIDDILHINPIYYQKLTAIVQISRTLMTNKDQLSKELLELAKQKGFSNEMIGALTSHSAYDIAKLCREYQLYPSYLRIDNSAGMSTPNVQSFYSTYNVETDLKPDPDSKKVLIIGMLPMQVSVTSEFDYMIAHACRELHNMGYVTILLSNNPLAVSTSTPDVDRLYLEPINLESIKHITEQEGIKDVLVQFSGKKINGMAPKLKEMGLNVVSIDGNLLESIYLPKGLLSVPRIQTDKKTDIYDFANRYGYPILIGGMQNGFRSKSAVVYDKPAIDQYLAENKIDQMYCSLFIEGNKYEITAISDGNKVTIPGIIEHLEQTGSHASDSIAVFKPQNLKAEDEQALVDGTSKLLTQLGQPGIFNLHFLVLEGRIYLLQIKPYAGHNVAFLSQAFGKDVTGIATQVLMGKKLSALDCPIGLWPANNLIHVKMPVFSYLDYEGHSSFDSHMKSSGSVMGRDTQMDKALYKGYEASDLAIPSYGTIFISVRDADKEKVNGLASRFHRLGFKIVATEGTANMLAEAGITTEVIPKLHNHSNSIITKIRKHQIGLIINITNLSDQASQDSILIRDAALSTHIPVCSTIDTAEMVVSVLESLALTTQPI